MLRPIFSLIIFGVASYVKAQVQVRYEPRHHNVFENAYVRILDVYISPNDTTQFHIHSTPSVFLSFTKTITASQLIGRLPSKGSTSVPGRPSYDSLNIPRIHRVWNEDSTWFHVMDIELTAQKPHSNEHELQNPIFKLAFDKLMANGYNVQLTPSDKIQLPASSIGYLLISTGDADISYIVNNSNQRRIMKAGHYIWIEAGKIAFISTNNNTTADFTLLQLK